VKGTIFSEHFITVHQRKRKIVDNEPLIFGFCVLELSKNVMYNFHYNVMKQKYEDKIKRSCGDTDSFIHKIQTEEFYEDMKSMEKYYNCSDYSEEHFLFSTKN